MYYSETGIQAPTGEMANLTYLPIVQFARVANTISGNGGKANSIQV